MKISPLTMPLVPLKHTFSGYSLHTLWHIHSHTHKHTDTHTRIQTETHRKRRGRDIYTDTYKNAHVHTVTHTHPHMYIQRHTHPHLKRKVPPLSLAFGWELLFLSFGWHHPAPLRNCKLLSLFYRRTGICLESSSPLSPAHPTPSLIFFSNITRQITEQNYERIIEH